MFTSFSQATSRLQADTTQATDGNWLRPDPALACHHEAGTYQIHHVEPYIPGPALNLPLFLCSLAIAPMLGLLLVLGDEAASASGMLPSAAPVSVSGATRCQICVDKLSGNHGRGIAFAQAPSLSGAMPSAPQLKE